VCAGGERGVNTAEFSRVQAALGARVAAWIRAVQRRPRATIAAVALLVGALGAAAWLRLGVNSDVNAMVAPDLPFRVREVAFRDTFPTGVEAILVVVEARDAATARRSADRLAQRLGEDRRHFRDVFLPWGGAFFRRNALLYLDGAELEALADRLAAAQPMLAELSRDGGAAGVFELLRRALELHRQAVDLGIELAPLLGHLSDALEASLAHRAAPDPWGGAGGLLGKADLGDSIQVISVEPNLGFSELLAAQSALSAIRADVAALGLDRTPGVRVRVTGDPILNYEEMLSLENQAVSLVLESLVIVGPLMWLAYRSTRLLGLALLNLAAGIIATAGFAALAVGDLNQLSIAFSVMLVGLGVDAGIYLTLRAAELAGPGNSIGESLPAAAEVQGGALLGGTLTTAIGFFAFLPTGFLGVAQLGLITGVGMIASLALTLTFLPALIAVGKPLLAPPPQPPFRWLRGLQHWPERHPRAICLAAVAAALAALPLLSRLRFDDDAVKLRDPRAESVQAFDELLRHSSTSPWTIDVVQQDLASANALARKLRGLPEVADAQTLSDYVPSDQAEKRETLYAIAGFLPASGAPAPRASPRAALDALRRELERTGEDARDPQLRASVARLRALVERFASGPGPADAQLAALAQGLLGTLPQQLDELRAALEPDASIGVGDLPREIRQRLLAPDGRARIEVTPRADLSNGFALERFASAVEAVAPEATGPAAVMVEWGRLASRSMEQAVGIAALAIAALLWFQWRRPLAVVLALAPLVLAALYTAAAMAAIDLSLNLANVVVVPMLMGIGTDCGIYMTERFHCAAPGEALLETATARGVLYAALTTLASFATLSLAAHRGMASLGLLLTLGLLATLLCYVMILPAALTWMRERAEVSERREP
jgi:hopanoid biosynthesis associated RND transporter like protein HpnN